MDHLELHTKPDEDWEFGTAKQWADLAGDPKMAKRHLEWLKRNDPVVARMYRVLDDLSVPPEQQDLAAVCYMARLAYQLMHRRDVSTQE